MFSRRETNQADQTEFVEESGFLENGPKKKFNFQEFKKNKHLLPFYILIGVIAFLVLLLILRLLLSKKAVDETGAPLTQESIEVSPLMQRTEELRQELKEDDPTKQSLPFPQVDLKFNIN